MDKLKKKKSNFQNSRYIKGCRFLTCLLLFLYTTIAAGQDRPNVLWITIEDTSPQFIGCYGNEDASTPVIDRLAEEGIRFTNAFSTGTVCSPSRSTIITGVRTFEIGTGNHRSNYPIPDFIHGFPYYLKQKGYYVTNNSKTDYNVNNAKEFTKEAWNESSDKAGWWNRASEEPFFSVFNFNEPHQSRTMTMDYDWYVEKIWDQLPEGDRIADDAFEMPPIYRDSPEMRKQFARVYNSIKLTDNRIGELLQKLEDDGLRDDTIIFFYADHGEGMPRGKTNGIDYGYRVPFIVWFPEKYKHLSPWGGSGTVTNELVSFEDLAPTLVSLSGGDVPDYMKGRILIGKDRSKPVDHLMLSSDRSDNGPDMVRSITNGRFTYSRNYMAFMPQLRHIHYMNRGQITQQMRDDLTDNRLDSLQKSVFQDRPAEFLFDLENDPWETNNLVDGKEHAPLLKKMRKQLDRKTIEARDVHFLPEYEIGLISNEKTPYEYRMDKNKYPFNIIYGAASLSGKRGKKVVERQVELLKNDNPIVRYWAITGLGSQDGSVLNPHKKEILEATEDTYAPVAISASTIAYQNFQNKEAAEKLKMFCQDDNTDLALMAVNALLYIDIKEPFVSTIKKVSQKPSLKYRVEAACMDFMYILGLAEKRTSFEPGSIWNDTEGTPINAHGGGMLVHDDTYYWFGEHKIAGRKGNTAQVGVRVYSSKDLYNWKNEGVALAVKEDTTSMLQRGSVIERPKVIYNDKTDKFVMWFHHELKGQGYKAAMTGTAVADQVTGPYTYLGSARIHPGVWPQNFTKQQQEAAEILRDEDAERKEKRKKGAFLYRDFKGGQMSRDMTLFKDDDGTAYHITSSEENATLLISRLTDDYLSLTDEYVRVFPGGNNEAPAVFKKDGKYYMITSGLTGWDPNPARSAVADDMMGPWKALGNPVRGLEEEKKTTFESQSTYVIPVQGKEDAYIFMADRWRPKNPIDGRYVWLPIEFEDGKPVLRWKKKWNLKTFE